jgi:hypothetical protein
MSEKLSRFQQKAAAARQAENAARRDAQVALNDRNALMAAVLILNGKPLALPQSLLDEAAALGARIRFERTASVLADTERHGFWKRLAALFSAERSARQRILSGPGGTPVVVPVLIVRWATDQELAAAGPPVPQPVPDAADTADNVEPEAPEPDEGKAPAAEPHKARTAASPPSAPAHDGPKSPDA